MAEFDGGDSRRSSQIEISIAQAQILVDAIRLIIERKGWGARKIVNQGLRGKDFDRSSW